RSGSFGPWSTFGYVRKQKRESSPIPMQPPISILLPTFNNESSVRDTLESVKWADEILVVDSFSTDNTVQICKDFGARVIQHEYLNSAKHKNVATRASL